VQNKITQQTVWNVVNREGTWVVVHEEAVLNNSGGRTPAGAIGAAVRIARVMHGKIVSMAGIDNQVVLLVDPVS
jgi:hypothetical protein